MYGSAKPEKPEEVKMFCTGDVEEEARTQCFTFRKAVMLSSAPQRVFNGGAIKIPWRAEFLFKMDTG